MLNILRQFNWLDVFVIIILVRIVYISFRNGFSVELFKLLGTLTATYVALHYFTPLTDSVVSRMPRKIGIFPIINFFSFTGLALTGYSIFMLFRFLFARFMKMEAAPALDKWGGLILGVIRGMLLSSLVVWTIFISDFNYFQKSVKHSLTGRDMMRFSSNIYQGIWDGVISKLTPKDSFNEEVLRLQEEIKK